MSEGSTKRDWRTEGVRIVKAGELDFNTPQTPGMTRAAAITFARAGAKKLWAGTVNVQPNAKTGAHHHGRLESIIYVVKGRARMPGASAWSSSPRPIPATSSTCRRTYRITRSTRGPTSRSSACWCAATRSRW